MTYLDETLCAELEAVLSDKPNLEVIDGGLSDKVECRHCGSLVRPSPWGIPGGPEGDEWCQKCGKNMKVRK